MTTIGTGTVTRVPYTVVSAIASGSTEVLTMPDVLPIVFVVDDDPSVRASLELPIKSAGWRPESFVSAQEFLSRPQSRHRRDYCESAQRPGHAQDEGRLASRPRYDGRAPRAAVYADPLTVSSPRKS